MRDSSLGRKFTRTKALMSHDFTRTEIRGAPYSFVSECALVVVVVGEGAESWKRSALESAKPTPGIGDPEIAATYPYRGVELAQSSRGGALPEGVGKHRKTSEAGR